MEKWHNSTLGTTFGLLNKSCKRINKTGKNNYSCALQSRSLTLVFHVFINFHLSSD